MPSDEYAAVARGALKMKGGGVKVEKKKKKKKGSKERKDKADEDAETALSLVTGKGDKEDGGVGKSEREEADGGGGKGEEDDEPPMDNTKTEAEKRFAEAKSKKLEEMLKTARENPERLRNPQLLKTHVQRITELNASLSRLSEHHDMPRIGPG